uniref:Serpentine Receptor, class H n=1 Tax=Panagrolaimus davidi TaxID=227884 RepID=A0A914QAM3_9BILA
MNCTKFIPPSPNFINFYFYYSYFVLFLTLTIAPLQIYAILTKSEKLNNLKWLILNHTIWCLAFEIFSTATKPFFFSPLVGGYPLGLLRNGNFKTTAFASYFGLLIGAISIAALTATLRSRYLLVFSAADWYKPKYGMILHLVLFILVFVPLSVLFLPPLFMEISNIHEMALNYDPCLENFFTEPAFFFLSSEKTKSFLIIEFSLMVVVLILAIILAIYFIFLVKTNIAATKTKLKTSLMISAIVQLSITICFYLIPISAFFAIFAFQIPNTENIMIVVICAFLTHSFLEFIVTLYFVRPYRKAVIGLFQQLNPFKNMCRKSRKISIVSNILVFGKSDQNDL